MRDNGEVRARHGAGAGSGTRCFRRRRCSTAATTSTGRDAARRVRLRHRRAGGGWADQARAVLVRNLRRARIRTRTDGDAVCGCRGRCGSASRSTLIQKGVPLTVSFDADVSGTSTVSGDRRVIAIGAEHWLCPQARRGCAAVAGSTPSAARSGPRRPASASRCGRAFIWMGTSFAAATPTNGAGAWPARVSF